MLKKTFLGVLFAFLVLGLLIAGINFDVTKAVNSTSLSSSFARIFNTSNQTLSKVYATLEEIKMSGILSNVTIPVKRTGGSSSDTCMVLIPPNAKVTNIERIEGNNSIRACGEIFFRCYKFAYLIFNVTDQCSEDYLNLTVSPIGPLMPYVEADELADPVISFLQNVENVPKLRADSWDLFLNLEKSSFWKAYPTYNVNKTHQFSLPSGCYQYIAIVPSDWVPALQPLLDWKERKGIRVYAAPIEWIYSQYAGEDNASKIREFIKDAFNTWRIRYVLLAGDTEVIPTRYVRVLWGNYGYTVGYTDRYYTNLDGNWDANNNGVYGETILTQGLYKFWVLSEDEWLPELAIGRLPAHNQDELESMVRKIVTYEAIPTGENWFYNMLGIAGEKSEGKPSYQWPLFGRYFLGLNQTWLVYGSNLTSLDQLKAYLNEGQTLVYVNSHGLGTGEGWWLGSGIEPFRYYDADSLINGYKLPIVFSEGCLTGTFDTSNCIAVRMLKNPNGGAIAYFGPNFGGHEFDWVFGFLFGGTGIYILPSQVAAKNFTFPEGTFRPAIACFQDIISCSREHIAWGNAFLGDPEMAIWTGKPEPLTISIPQKIYLGHDVTISILSSTTGQPLRGIVTRILTNTSWIELTTNQTGQVAFKAPSSPGNLSIQLYALFRNQPTQVNTTVQIIPDNTPPVTLNDYVDAWHAADFAINLTANDYESGVAETYYRINDGPVKAVSVDGQPLITTEGANNTLEYWSVDNAGNEELPHNVLTGIKLDKTPPTSSINLSGTSGNEGWFISDVTVLISANDTLSGVDKIEYSFNNTTWAEYTALFIIADEGQSSIYYRSIDKAGNAETARNATIKIDKTAPLIGIPSRIPEGNVEPDQKVEVLVNVTDSLSGVKNVILAYNLNGSTLWINLPMTFNSTTGLYETAIQVQQANTLVRYEIAAYDNAGNYRVEDKNGEYYVYTVIPEFPSTLILSLPLTTLIATALLKKKRKTKPQLP